MALINVYTIWHNRDFAVRDSISSLLEQSFTDFQLVALDDGSTDSTLTELLKMKSVAASKGIQMKVVSRGNSGFTKSLIWAISRYCNSEFIAIHGAGDISLERRLEAQVAEAEKSAVALVGCWVNVVGKDGALVGVRRVPRKITHNLMKYSIGRPGTHGAALMRRSAYLSCGGYREEFEYAQDADLWLRIVNEGRAVNCQEVLYQKVQFENSVSLSNRKRTLQRMYSTLAVQMADSTPNEAERIYRALCQKSIVGVFPVRRLLWRLLRGGRGNFPLATIALHQRLKFYFSQITSMFPFRLSP